jgi:hypothetical protein
MDETAGPRPNPFAVPSATAVRFALLVIAASTAVFLYGPILVPAALEEPSTTADTTFGACFRKFFDNAAHRDGNANPFAISTYLGLSSVDMVCGSPPSSSLWLNFTTLALFWLELRR